MSEVITGGFNYGSVDDDTAKKLEYFAKSVKALLRNSQIQFVADMGRLLSEARQVLAHHGDGKFVKWATAEFDVSAKTVYRYVNAWDECLCHGVTNYLNWSQTALYLAYSDETPIPVRKKLERLPATDFVRTSDVKRLIAAETPKPEPVEEPADDEAEANDPEPPESASDEPEFAIDDVDEFPEDETMAELCQRETSEIESWARKFGDLLKEAQKALAAVPTLDELNARDGWERKLKEALATLRGTKPVLCPICQGDGGKKCPCGGHGRVTKQQHGQMV